MKDRVRQPPSTFGIGLFVLLFAANIAAAIPAVATPISTLLRRTDPMAFVLPALLLLAVMVGAVTSLRKKRARASRWLLWVALPAFGLVLCLISMLVPWAAIPLAIYSGIVLLGQVVIMSFFGGEDIWS